MGVANDPLECDPERDLFRPAGPMLTVEQAAIIQGFSGGWKFQGKKTAQYRQVGNAFPPPVAEAVGRAIAAVLRPERRDELLHGYDMETRGALQDVPRTGQMALPVSVASRVGRPARNNRSGDLAGADV